MIDRRRLCLGASSLITLGMSQTRAASKETIVGIDCHAHVFTRALKLADVRRYAPDYDASISDYIAMLDANRMSHGVLIQPSFLGTDNSYMLEALAAAPGRLHGIAVVDPSISLEEMRDLDKKGIVGIRLNLIGKPDPDFSEPVWATHVGRLVDLGWQIEIQAEAKRWPVLLPPLLARGATIVVDHFGLPDKEVGIEDPGFRYLLSVAATRKVWVKVSAPYRSGKNGEAIARAAFPMLRDAFGDDHLIWGSDWPHTQFESTASPAKAKTFLASLATTDGELKTILVDAPARLFRFAS